MNERTTHWIAGGVTATLWGATAVTAVIQPHIQVYITVLSAAVMSTLWGLTRVAGAITIRRDEQQRALVVAATREGVAILQAAIVGHAGRMEHAVTSHGNGLRTTVFTAERWMRNGGSAERMAARDATEAAAARNGRGDSGQFQVVRRA